MPNQVILESFFKWIEDDVSGERDPKRKADLLHMIMTDQKKAREIIFNQIHPWAISFKHELGSFSFDEVAEIMFHRLGKTLAEQVELVAA